MNLDEKLDITALRWTNKLYKNTDSIDNKPYALLVKITALIEELTQSEEEQ